jgi:hypothetical protein
MDPMSTCIVLLSGKGQIRLPGPFLAFSSGQAIAGQDGHGGHYVDIDLYGFIIIKYIHIYIYQYIHIYTMNHH